MCGVAIDLTGKRYGNLLVVGLAPRQGPGTWWRCTCDCGNSCVKPGKEFTKPSKRGWVHSCGCRAALARSFKNLPTRTDRGRLTMIHVEQRKRR